jgi:pSer/pThr/pTyr-binding forkhead associated (FHA) protein
MHGLELEVTKGPWAGQKISVNEEYRLGSAEPGPGSLGSDRWLSPAHARFHPGADAWMLEDRGSLEGTKVNGRAIRASVPLQVGDVIELGSSRIVVLPDGTASVARCTPRARPAWRTRFAPRAGARSTGGA